jgi:hypothetical protein
LHRLTSCAQSFVVGCRPLQQKERERKNRLNIDPRCGPQKKSEREEEIDIKTYILAHKEGKIKEEGREERTPGKKRDRQRA